MTDQIVNEYYKNNPVIITLLKHGSLSFPSLTAAEAGLSSTPLACGFFFFFFFFFIVSKCFNIGLPTDSPPACFSPFPSVWRSVESVKGTVHPKIKNTHFPFYQ